jgi:hypothetical protein
MSKVQKGAQYGPHGDLNSGPPAPKAGIIPLDHADTDAIWGKTKIFKLSPKMDLPVD